ncbi:unnamed protein product [Rotaria sordida]|uniref:VWFA domain-containing protein n=1 Tax=Rotaria sordida TaxID=392033 RepID=A0A815NH98_9BILA|nr:unnamed protein product [Rotaria sordida]CAF1437758.1 unnamed protein product [Rotaria sordida]CAF4025623.1 unnamed protein product [Rotaria sordida]
MFGTLFDVRNGRCTRGVYGSFVKSNIPSFDYIMLLDTEGLLGTEKGDPEYDRRLILFCLAVSHLVIVNIAGDLNQALKDMIILCVDSLKEINVNKMPTPILHFILNQRPDTNLANNQKAIKNIVDQLHTDTPDKTIAISVEQFHSLPSAFKVENILNNPKLPKLQITSNDFLEETTQLTKVLVQSATVNCQRFTDQKGHSDHYIDPLKWIQNAFTIFDVLQRFPDLTHFKDLKEKKLDKQIRNGIRKLLETKLSSTEKQKSLDGCSSKTRSQIDEIFQISFDGIYKECEKCLQTIFEELGPSATIRERSAQFLKTQVYEARNAWRDAAYRAHDENELNLLVRNGEQDLRNLINKTIKEAAENGTDLTEEKARKIFNDMYKKKMKSIQEQFNAKERLQNAVIAVYSLYDIYEKECLPTLQIILHYLPIIERISNDYSPNSLMHTDANSTDDEVEIDGQKERRPIPFHDAIEIIRKELSSITPERSMIETQHFTANLNASYTEEIIDKMKYLKKKGLKDIYSETLLNNDNNRNGHQSNKSDRGFLVRIKQYFKPPSSNVKVIDQKLTDYRYTIHNHISDRPSDVLDVSVCFRTLFENIINEIQIKTSPYRQEQYFHPIDLQLIQKIVSSVNSLITQIDNELFWFNVVISKPIKERFHTCIVILLTRIYYHVQKNHFEAQLSLLKKNKDSLLNNFIMKTVHGATRDTECAKDLTNALLETIKEQFKTKAHLLIEKIIQENYAKLNRAFLLDLCDQKVNRITDKVWIRKYVEKPRIVMEEEFVNDWNRTEQAINNKIIEEKLSQQQILSKFFTLIQDISGKIQQTSLGDDIHFISDALQSFGGDAEQNRINKGKCMAVILYSYITGQQIQSAYIYGTLQYRLNNKVINLFSDLSQPNGEVITLTGKLENKFDLLTLVNFPLFLREILKHKESIVKLFASQPCTLTDINPKIKAETSKKGQGCSEDCECCGRPCDVDHTLSATPIGKDDNCHRCDKGHQYRAFKGFKYETDSTKPEDKYEPSLITCEDVEENQTIRHERSGFEGSWCEFKKRFPAWYFGDNAIDKKSANTEQARNRYDKIWRLIGPDLCAENKWKYVVINSKPKISGVDTTPKHFFFLVDGSGSMGDNTEASRWSSLKKSVLKFVQIRQMYTADRITIISFADSASITCDNEQIKNVKDLTRINGGTSFPNVIETLNKALDDMKKKGSSLNNVIAFMSDGEDIYPQKQLEELKAKHGSTIKLWFTIAAATNKRILTQINDAMKGKLIDVTEDINIEGGLMKAFVEIANVK